MTLKIKNIPEKIYLQVESWESCICDDEIDFNDLDMEAVTWWADRINTTDIEYVLKKQP